MSTPELLEDSPETVNPRKLHARINSLYDSGRLQDALGEKGANDLFDHTLENSAAQSKILRNRKIAMTARNYGGVAALWTRCKPFRRAHAGIGSQQAVA